MIYHDVSCASLALTPNANGSFTLVFADVDNNGNRFIPAANGNVISFNATNPIERALSIVQIKSLISR